MAKTHSYSFSNTSLFTASNKYGFLFRLTGIQLDTDKEKGKCGVCAHRAAECCSPPAHSSVPWGRLQPHLCSSLRLSLHDCNAHAALLQAVRSFLGLCLQIPLAGIWHLRREGTEQAGNAVSGRSVAGLWCDSCVLAYSSWAGRGLGALWHLWML